jgi:hypothetical protein
MESNRLIFSLVLALALTACGDDRPASKSSAEDAKTVETPVPAASPPAPPAAIDIPGGAMSKEALASSICFFSPEEVQAALGFAVPAGKPNTKMLDAYGTASCRYEGEANVLQVNAIWVDPAQLETTRQYMSKLYAGGRDVLPGDADGAYVQDQGEIGGALHYVRRNVMIEIRPLSWRGDRAAMKAKLLSLRRVP